MPTTSSPFALPTTSMPVVAADHVRLNTSDAAIDQVLVHRFTDGDEAAFVEIMSRYRSKIFSVSHGLLRNYADAEEITQDTFIRAHRGLVNFRGESSLSTWLYRIAINLSRNRYWYFFRRRRSDWLSLNVALTEGSTATFAELVADSGHNPAEEAAMKEFATIVDDCMHRLDHPHREILMMRNSLHRSYDEIAKALGINPGTVKSRIARARFNLRSLLTEACPEFAVTDQRIDCFLTTRVGYGSPALASA